MGQIAIGYLIDRSGPSTPMVGLTLCASIAVLSIWISSRTFHSLLTFALLYGISIGGYSVLYCRFVTALTNEPAAGLWLYSIFEFQSGLGSLVGGVVASALVGDIYAAEKYLPLILFIGIAFFTSSLSGMSYWILRML
jgi:hypothetical protein